MSDFSAELHACLDVLIERVDSFDGPAWALAPEREELLTACWQTVELVISLLTEHEQAWAAVLGLRQLVNDLQAKLAEKDGRLWTPSVTLPS